MSAPALNAFTHTETASGDVKRRDQEQSAEPIRQR
jgi:hypothetical protein